MTCNVHIGRMVAIGLGKETTPGTAVDPTVWIPATKAQIKPVIKTVEDDSNYGIIDRVADVRTVENTSMTEIGGIVRDDFFGHILMAAFGISSAPSLVETGVHRHDFTRLNSNCPITYTATEDGPAGTKQAPYTVLDSLTIEAKAGDYIRFDAQFVGGKLVTTTDKNPAYTQQKPFLAAGMTVKMADNLAGLPTGTSIKAISFKLTISKSPEMVMTVGSDNVESIHNTTFEVKGDMELKYDSDNYLQMVVDGSKKALGVSILGPDLIGATKKSELGYTLPLLAFSEWSRSDDADKIATQTVGFTGTFSIADAMTIAAYLVNTTSAQY